MSPIAFPPLEPIAEEGGRELKLGRFPNRRYEPANGGSATVRGFGSLSVDATLRISFGVITDQQMADVWIAFDAAQGDYRPLALPEKFFFGIDPALLAKIPPTLEWHFPPGGLQYEQVAPGFTKLEPITFVGQLALQYPSGVWTPPEAVVDDGSWVGAGQCDRPWGYFDPLSYTQWRPVGDSIGAGWWNTATTRPYYEATTGGPPCYFNPRGPKYWFGGSDMTMSGPCSASGNLASIYIVSVSTNAIQGILRQWFGSVNQITPFLVTNPITFEFTNDGGATIVPWTGIFDDPLLPP